LGDKITVKSERKNIKVNGKETRPHCFVGIRLVLSKEKGGLSGLSELDASNVQGVQGHLYLRDTFDDKPSNSNSEIPKDASSEDTSKQSSENSVSSVKTQSDSPLARPDLIFTRIEKKDDGLIVKCKQHPDGYFLVRKGQWDEHLKAYHEKDEVLS
nr:hypothetical protein [Nitrososphaerota archaeon]